MKQLRGIPIGYLDRRYVNETDRLLRPPVEDWHDPTGGLPADPAVGDRYISDATAGGWTIDYIYEWDGDEWVEYPPEEGWMVWMLIEFMFYMFFSGGWAEVGDKVGVDMDATPGYLGAASDDGVLRTGSPISYTDGGNFVTLDLSADGINDTHIDWGTGANQVSALDVPITDAGDYYTGTEVETALSEIYPAFADNTIDSAGCSLIGIDIIAGATWTNQCHFNSLHGSAGRASGGEVTDATGGDVNIAAGTGWIKATDEDDVTLLSFDWAASNGVDIPINTTRYIGVEYNDGSPQIVVKTTDTWDLDTDFPLATVTNVNESLHIMNNPWWVTDGFTNIIERADSFGRVMRDTVVGGLVIGESADDNRDVTLSAGKLWARLNEFDIAELNTAVTGDFHTLYRASPSGWTMVTGVTEWDNAHYDDGDGTLGDLSNNWYMNLWWYMVTDGTLHMIYGQAQYANSASAEAEAPPSSVPEAIDKQGLLIGRFIIKGGQTQVHQIQTVWTTQFTAAQAADHGNLTGLDGDDHTQYALLAGRSGGQTLSGSDTTAEDLTLEDNSVDGNTITVTQLIAAHTHIGESGASHTYIDQSVISGATPTFTGTNITAVASITAADESADTTCFPLFAISATGTVAVKTGTNLTFNSDTGLLTATTLAGANTNWDAAYTHIGESGASHTYINQNVTTTGTPTFGITTLADESLLASSAAPTTDAMIANKKYVDDTSGAGGGASTALDNLASVAINASLLPATDSAIDLGSATPKYFANAYIDKIYLDADSTIEAVNVDNWGTAYTHVGESGASHTYIDQSVISGASPTFDGNNFTGVDADDVDIADAGTLITATQVEGALQENRTAINLNTDKNTNVSTALSVGTVGVNTVAITSDGGADDVTLPAATVDAAGMLTTAKWAEIVANTGKSTNVSTALSTGTVNATTYGITSDGGADDVVLVEADTDYAGLLGADKWDEIVANTVHRGDNSQAHSDYLINTGDDITAGSLTIQGGRVTAGTTAQTGTLELYDGSDHKITFAVPSIAGDYTLTLPTTDGDASQFLQTDGNGALTWAAASGSTDGWTAAGSWSYASATTITVPAGAASIYTKGDRIKLTQTTVKYWVIRAVANQLLTIIETDDYTLANAAISDNYYSHADKPLGFPSKFSWTTTYTGFSTDPTGKIDYTVSGGRLFITFYSSTGISNATNFNFTLPAPENNTVGGFVVYPAEVYDNNSWQNTVGVVGISASEARVGISNSTQSANAYGGFTASSNKAVHVGLSYPL